MIRYFDYKDKCGSYYKDKCGSSSENELINSLSRVAHSLTKDVLTKDITMNDYYSEQDQILRSKLFNAYCLLLGGI